MNNKKIKILIFSITAVLISGFFLNPNNFYKINKTNAQTADLNSSTSTSANSDQATAAINQARQELEKKIQIQNEELAKLNKQMQETQNKLDSTKSEKLSLQKELNTIKSNINQLNLSIKTDKVNIEKLNLEIKTLNYDITDIEKSAENKKASVGDTLRTLQQTNENLLTIVLKGKSLADSMLEAQSLSKLNTQLLADITELNNLRKQKADKIDTVSSKKNEISLRQKNLENKKSIIQDQEGEKQTLLADTKNKESTYEKELADLKKKQNEIADQISQIEDSLRSKFNTDLLPSKKGGLLAWPVKLKSNGGTGRITQHFGEVSSLYNGKAHNGLDIGTPIGTPVFAADDGRVIASDNNDRSSFKKYQYGNYILIEHADNFATLYGHLSKRLVTAGSNIKRGDLIGYSGNTGYSTGAHLHFGLYWAPSVKMQSVPPAAGLVPVGVVINPENYL
ncbi:MAG: peptidoglycan DD-metalloendopeptidase family protein [Candidatus Paceibacterota bacterium]